MSGLATSLRKAARILLWPALPAGVVVAVLTDGIGRVVAILGVQGVVAGLLLVHVRRESWALRRAIRQAADRSYAGAEAYVQLCRLLPDLDVRGFRGWAMSADACLHLVERVRELRPSLVVELGSGRSTLVLAQALERYSPAGRLVSVDHDPEYARRTREELREHGHGHAEVRLAPLVEWPSGDPRGPATWYAPEVFDDLDGIGMLLVDGPPATHPLARLPVVELLTPKLAPGSVVVVDDADRAGEREIVRRWSERLGVAPSHLDAERGLVVLELSR